MLVLIDESGDCGLKFGLGSSDFLICVAAVFASSFAADACDRGIDELRRKLKKKSSFEFHFTHCSDRLRKEFLKTVVREDFLYAGFAVDKRRLYGKRFNDPKQVYEFSVGIVCEHVRPLLDNSKIILDKNGDRLFRMQLDKRLRARMTDGNGKCLVRKVAMEHSHTNNLLQLTDMLCGSVARSVTHGDQTYRGIIQKKEKFVQVWPSGKN